MPRSVLILILAFTAVSVASCSTATAPKPGPPPFVAHSTTLAVTNGIKVLTNVEMPAGFAPIATRPPIWLQEGEKIGVVGTQAGHTIMYGLGGAAWRTGRILAAETGPAAAEEGTIADLAASPNGLTLATAMVAPGGDRVDVIVRDLIATGPGNVIASFNGDYDSISISWLNNATIALALRQHPEPLEPGDNARRRNPTPIKPDVEPPPISADGLQLIVITGAGSVAPLKLPCPMSSLSWSAHGVYAVGQGDAGTPPMIIDRRNATCTRFHVLESDPRARLGHGRRRLVPVRRPRPLWKYDRRLQVQHRDRRRTSDGRIDRRGLVRRGQRHGHARASGPFIHCARSNVRKSRCSRKSQSRNPN